MGRDARVRRVRGPGACLAAAIVAVALHRCAGINVVGGLDLLSKEQQQHQQRGKARMQDQALEWSGMEDDEYAGVYDYKTRKKFLPGEWTPSAPPPREVSSAHAWAHGTDMPIPTSLLQLRSRLALGSFNSRRLGEAGALGEGGSRKLMMISNPSGEVLSPDGMSPMGAKIPASWYGKGRYQTPVFTVATGFDMCLVCKYMLLNSRHISDNQYSFSEGAEVTEVEMKGIEVGKRNLCTEIEAKYFDMCVAYLAWMVECPSFKHNICHEDLGGNERLRAPCPDHLKCYYCLRINPLYCMYVPEQVGFGMR